MSIQQIHDLYLKFIKGECTRQEIDLLIELLKTVDHSDGLPTVVETQQLEQEIGRLNEAASDRIFQNIITVNEPLEKNMRGGAKRLNWMIAASIIGLLVCGILTYMLLLPHQITYQAGFAKQEHYTLPDGTRVILNANTVVKINKSFVEDKKREVWLSGEAFFQVARQQAKPFIIHTPKGLEVRVLGTSFNLKARPTETHVVLNSGSVKVGLAHHNREAKLLVPGEMARLTANQQSIETTSVDTLYYAAWQYHLLPFKNEPLIKVTDNLQDIYGCKAAFANHHLEQMHFTGSLPSDDLDKAVKTLAAALNCDIYIDKSNNHIIIQPLKLIN